MKYNFMYMTLGVERRCDSEGQCQGVLWGDGTILYHLVEWIVVMVT